jgi:integrase
VKVSVYTRQKNEAGQWRYHKVKLGRGHRTSTVSGPFYLRFSTYGRKIWEPAGDSLEGATEAAETRHHALEAQARGLSVTELDTLSNAGRIPIKTTCEAFLKLKAGKAKKTLAAYSLHLAEFQEAIGSRVRFMDAINADTMRRYRDWMAQKGLSPKTQHTRLLTVTFLLKKNGFKNPLAWDEFPVFEVETAVPYSPDELKKLFPAMDAEEKLRYRFFLGSGLREAEVTYCAWPDLDLSKGTVTVRPKADVGFTPKSHESRSVPLPAPLIAELKVRKKNPPHARWIFVNKISEPEKHFLRKLKRIALRAGLNCGHCTAEVTRLTRQEKRARDETIVKAFDAAKTQEQMKTLGQTVEDIRTAKRTVTCKTDPVCQHFILHRFRKSCATRWMEAGVPIRSIQAWLGHKDLETTMNYLGTGDMNAPQTRVKVDAAFVD